MGNIYFDLTCPGTAAFQNGLAVLPPGLTLSLRHLHNDNFVSTPGNILLAQIDDKT